MSSVLSALRGATSGGGGGGGADEGGGARGSVLGPRLCDDDDARSGVDSPWVLSVVELRLAPQLQPLLELS